ncbi:BQ5605_C007g04861 [Microbotryum silenes-dioicae]|uniref:BQ5605_C007g04861 protein n=1 Tax=Microbotryum silenes-dioicae TaxID=796604 RepID=A0A2X0N298_9BASI|nr:BQ5605_C007g04861 [Microbotryum silenes-dioicae]
MPKDSLGTHQAAEETGTSVGEVIIPFRTDLGLGLIGCWRRMRCHFPGIFLCGFGMQRWTSVQHLFRVIRLEARQQVLMRMLCARGSNDDVQWRSRGTHHLLPSENMPI